VTGQRPGITSNGRPPQRRTRSNKHDGCSGGNSHDEYAYGSEDFVSLWVDSDPVWQLQILLRKELKSNTQNLT